MANLEGIFYVLIVGSVFAVFINITEMLFDVRARSKEFKVRVNQCFFHPSWIRSFKVDFFDEIVGNLIFLLFL